MKYLFSFLIFMSVISLQAQVDGYDINFNIKNYDNDTLIVGFYYGDRQLVKDTLFAEAKGKFSFKGEEKMDGGMYLLLFKPKNDILQFLMPEEDQTFDLECDYKDLSLAKVSGETDNEAFFNYLAYLKDMRSKADPLRAEIEKLKEEGKNVSKEKAELDLLDEQVVSYRLEVIKNNPNSVTGQLLGSNVEVEIPEFEGKEDEVQMKRYRFYKKHFFDNIDFSYPSLIRTPYFFPKVDNYIEKLTPQAPDSLKESLDYILNKLKGNEDAYRFCLSNFLNKYAKNKFIGMDALYVHLVDKYYAKGEADWVDEETLEKMKENANNLRPILIGETFPNITVYKEDESPLMIHNVESPYTLVIFWAPDCGHCKKSMPKIIDFYEKFKDKGLKVVSVCTKSGKKFDNCWKYIEEKGMENFINTGDRNQRYRRYVYIPSTPKMFMLDKDKEILIKDIPADELENLMNDLLKEDTKKSE